ncbi:ankyrin repeat-containing domain protein [Dactylonectria macrodidyma]|uniref:Ankyrin repeat-containing domain protein n=1 Tax=Dactylonectria macrodidyma TaxID=307937 RepID=A0A9P9E6P0_9HYPO|nr:ankyrin repeat-containing domain protein [Dactylonectria macrodidyma]
MKRNTSVSILRGLIFLLLLSRLPLISHILPDYEYQREALFSQDSLEALWRVFENMLKDKITGKVFCLIDGLDECREDSLQPFVRKISDFFCTRQQQEKHSKAGGTNAVPVNPTASLKMVLVSQEKAGFLSEYLSQFLRIKLGARQKIGSCAENLFSRPNPNPITGARLKLNPGEEPNGNGNGKTQALQPLEIYIQTKVTDLAQRLCLDQGVVSYAALFQFHIGFDNVSGQLAACCLNYLEQGCLKKGPVSKLDDVQKFNARLLQFPLLAYAVKFWPEHLRSTTGCTLNLSSPFFQKGKNCLEGATRLQPAPYRCVSQHWFSARELEQQGGLKARLNAQDSQGNTPLGLAAVMGNMGMFVLLIERGASQPFYGRENLLTVVCRKGKVQIAKYLLDKGHDANHAEEAADWMKLAGGATRYIHGLFSEAKDWKKEAPWRLYTGNIGEGETPLHCACFFGHLSVTELLLSRGASVHKVTTTGWTPLHTAAWACHEDCARLLINHGANPLDATNEGWNPMHLAALQGQTLLVSQLLELGVPIDSITVKKKTALHLAAQKGRSCQGETPLHLAARSAEPEAVETLLAAGSDRLITNNEGKTAADAIGTIESGLIDELREIRRILATYGDLDYIPWKSKVEANV